MNLDSLSLALSQISYSVANITKKNYKSSIAEISHLISHHGAEASRHLFRCLFSHVDFTGDGKGSGKDFHQTQFLIQELGTLISKPNFVSTLCYAVDNPLHHQKTLRSTGQLLPQLCRVLKLNRFQEVVFGLSLLNSSSSDTVAHAVHSVRQKLPHLLNSYIDADSGSGQEVGLQDTPIEVLHLLLTHLFQGKDKFGISREQKEAFLKLLRRDFPQDRVPAVLSPLLYPGAGDIGLDKLNPAVVSMPKSLMEGSLSDMIMEVGYVCTSSIEECRNTLVQFGVREITSASVARILGMMAMTPTGLQDPIQVQTAGSQSSSGSSAWGDSADKPDTGGPSAWNIDIIVQVVKDLAPHLNWRDVITELDHPGFMITSKAGLRLIVQALFRALQEVFPVELILRPWNNTEGQITWISHSLKNPDVFCFADYNCHQLVIDILKTPPDSENRDIKTWKSLDLVETLLRLSAQGHYQQCMDLFKFPLQHCPDMLVLAMLQISTWNTLKHDLLSSLMPIFLGNHSNSGIVLHYAWHCQGQSTTTRTLIMHAMAEWYMRGEHHDQGRLSRILDVAQDLKALSMLLNATPFAFVIDLACLASRREYLKLDKWLSDKIREHGEPFIQACVHFLKRRCPQLMGIKEDQQLPAKSQQLPPEAITTMLTCMQACISSVMSQELSDNIMTMLTNASAVLSKVRQQPPTPGVGVVGSKGPPLTPGPQLSGLQNPVTNPMDALGSIGALGLTNPGISASTPMSNPFPASFGSLTTPASPAKSIPSLGPVSQGGQFNPLQSITSQLQGMPNPGMPSSGMPSIGMPSLGMPSTGMPTIGMPSTGLSSTSMPSTVMPSTGMPSIGMPSIGMPSIGMPSIGMPSIGMPSIGMPSSGLPGTGMPSTGMPSSGMQSTGMPSTGMPSTGMPSTGMPSTGMPSTGMPSTGMPSTGMPSTGMPSTGMPNSGMPSMAARGTPTLGPLGTQVGVKPPPSVDPLRSQRTIQQSFPKEIEDEANSYFQRIYNHPPHPTISIDEVLDMLKRFKDSLVKKEKDVFACMLRNLFEEYKFFPQYPEKELNTTAVLFGGIIEQGLVTYMDLGIALRYVLEALKKQHGSKMYSFGIAALDRFKTRLKDYPQYCQFLASIPHFGQFPRHLREYVEYGARSQEPPNKPQGPITPILSRSLTPVTTAATSTPTSSAPAISTPIPTQPAAMPAVQQLPPVAITMPVTTPTPASTAAPGAIGAIGAIARPTNVTRPSIANATNIDTLLAGTEGKEETAVPPESTQDKVFFIFNNLSLSNMEQKASELNEHITDEFWPWVAQYLVMKRASIEHNFHTLYANFIDAVKRTELMQMVINETFRNIKVLLRSDKGVANFSDRSLLKNLGHWLGMLLLARNKPILAVEIDLKSLLYEAYHKGAQELLYVVPFVAKVLESTAKSKIFKPPNPWTMAIMNVLSELHTEPDLKLNLKFEIEVLCKTLNIDFNELTPTNYLKDPSRYSTLEHQLSAPSKVKESSSTPQPEEPLQINMPTPTTTSLVSTITTSSTVTTTTPVVLTPQPRFCYQDINVMSLAGLASHIVINEQLPIFANNPQLKQLVRPAIERSVQELLPPVVERSMKIALTTCEQIVKKDFALDPEEPRMRAAAQHMVKFMTAGMALITCREPLLVSINNNIKQAFLAAAVSPAQKDMIEPSAQVMATDNVELACAFIQKTAVEKAIPEMDKRLATEYELRKHARNEGRRYCDPVVLTYQAERMPEQIRLKVGGVTHQQIAVYEEFSRGTPGFTLAAQEGTPGSGPLVKPQTTYMSDEVVQIYDKLCREIEQHLHAIIAPPSNPQMAALSSLLEAVVMARHTRDMVTAVPLLQKAIEGLLEGLTSLSNDPELILRYRDCHLLVLRRLQDPRAHGQQWVNKQVTRCLIECREEHKFNLEAVDCLIRSQLVNMQQYDMHLSQSMENGLNYMAVAFAMQLVQRFLLDDKHGGQISEADFFNTVETLARIAAHSRQAPEGLTALIETIRQQSDGVLLDRTPGGPASMMQSGISQAREFDDPPGLHEKTEFLLREWVNLYHSPAAGRDSSKAFCAIVSQMHQQGILKTDDLITRFFRLCTEMCVDLCYRALADQSHSATLIRAKCFHTLDAFVRLIALLVKHSGDSTNTVTKINLLNKVLGIVAGVLLQDHEVRHTDFHQLPFHRIFIMLFIELNAPEHILESINYQVLTAFCHTFHILRPAKAPGFAYAWLELVSHRVFIGRMLAITPQQRGWTMYANLLIDLFRFLAPFLRNAELTKPTQLLYKGTLRVLLVLLHDFPEFLCDYYYAFCDVIPPNCIQMRNLILSTFPRNMRLPDPFTPNLKVDLLPEISHTPRIITNISQQIQATFKKDLDSYLKIRTPVTFLSELRSKLQISTEPGVRYNIPLINALVLYVGTQAISYIHQKGLTPSMSTIAHSSHMDIFQNLAVDLDTEGRYLFLNAIANQLRYPNSHTHYFSCTLLYLFAEANSEAIQEQITRVLLERLIVNRPHPWGLLVTFIELIKNPQFKFWNHEFVRCAPEIEKLFESVARSCIQPKQPGGVREAESWTEKT